MKNKKSEALFCCVLFCIIITVAILHSKTNYNNNYYKNRCFYMVSLAKTRATNSIDKLKSMVSSVDGAGFVYEQNNYYYVLLACYNQKSKAETKVKEMASKFNGCEIIKIDSDDLSNKMISILEKENQINMAFIKMVEVTDLSFKFVSKQSSASYVYNCLNKNKLELKKIAENLGKNTQYDNVCKVLHKVIDDYATLINSISAEIYQGKSLVKSLNKLSVESVFLEQRLRKKLNTL